MYAVDPAFKMSYDLRNGQEYAGGSGMRAKRQSNTASSGGAYPQVAPDTFETDQHDSGSRGIRWVFMVALTVLGIGTGFQLGRDQYHMHKAACNPL